MLRKRAEHLQQHRSRSALCRTCGGRPEPGPVLAVLWSGGESRQHPLGLACIIACCWGSGCHPRVPPSSFGAARALATIVGHARAMADDVHQPLPRQCSDRVEHADDCPERAASELASLNKLFLVAKCSNQAVFWRPFGRIKQFSPLVQAHVHAEPWRRPFHGPDFAGLGPVWSS